MKEIQSRDHAWVRRACALMAQRRQRLREGVFAIEGLRICREAVLQGAKIDTVFMTEDFLKKHPEDASLLVESCEQSCLISVPVAQKLSGTVNPQGVFCLCAIPKAPPICGTRYIALENLQDPGNVGTIIRTAEAFGADGVFLIGHCVDVYSPKVLRSTMGTVFRLPLYFFNTPAEACKPLLQQGFEVFGALLGNTAQSLTEIRFPEKCVCLIGNEGNGLSEAAVDVCSRQVKIDMCGAAESLNAAIAASVILWEMQKNAGR